MLEKFQIEKYAVDIFSKPEYLVVNKGRAERLAGHDRLYVIAIERSNDYIMEFRESHFDSNQFSFSITKNPSVTNFSNVDNIFSNIASDFISTFGCETIKKVEGSNPPESINFYNELVSIKRGWYEQSLQ